MNDETRFTLTDDHIKLIQNFYIYFEDQWYNGAPAVDSKRPYGNSWVAGDVHEILTGEYCDELTEEQEAAYLKIHRETATALQIILVTKSFTPGTYIKYDRYEEGSWTLV